MGRKSRDRRSGAWALGRLGAWALGRLGAWALGRLGAWALVNVIKSHSPTMVVSNNLDAGINVDVPNDGGGASRKLDIQKVPFSWPPATKGNGHLWVWSRSLMKRVRAGQSKQGGGPVR